MTEDRHSDKLNSSVLKNYDNSRRMQVYDLIGKDQTTRLRPIKVINELMPLIQQQPFFSSLANNFRVLAEICQKIQCVKFDTNQSIYKLKDVADKFYIILDGTVHLTLPEVAEIHQIEEVEQNSTQKTTKDIFAAFLNIPISKKQVKTQKQIELPEQKELELDIIIKIVEKGESFGEMMGERSLRTTNAIAIEPCIVLALNRKIYDTLIKVQHKSDSLGKFMFISSLPQFSQIRTFALQSLCLLIKEKTCSYGQVLFRERQQINEIFIIREGQFKLIKSINKLSIDSLSSSKEKSQYKSTVIPRKEVPYRIVQAGQILGDGETLNLQSAYQQMCVCLSQFGIVYAIDKKQFFKTLMTDQSSFEVVRRVMESRSIRRKQMTRQFVSRRTQIPQFTEYQNKKQWIEKIRHFRIKRNVDTIANEQMISDDRFFLNEFNKTIIQSPHRNRLSLKCRTEVCEDQKPNSFVCKKKKVEIVPHCVRDIVSLVKFKANFQKQFRQIRKSQRVLFKFNSEDVPLYIKSKYNKIQV